MHRATLVGLTILAVTLLVNISIVAAAQSGVALEHSVTVDGISRKYLVFAPKEFDKPLPVVLAFHGGGSKARQMERYTRFDVRRNGNQGEPSVTTLDRDKEDGTSVEIRKYRDGPGGVKTQVYVVRNGGHTWAGRPLYLPEMLIGKASQEFSATEVIWEFFKSCPPRLADPATKNSR